MTSKEIAKFFAGFAANQVLTHGALAAAGVRFSLFGMDYDQRLNTLAAFVWGIVLVMLAYYAWGRK